MENIVSLGKYHEKKSDWRQGSMQTFILNDIELF